MDRRSIIGIVVGIVIVVVIVAVALALVNQPKSGSNSPQSTQNAQIGSSVEIKNFAFDPGTETVSSGTTVTWTNHDSTTHTVTFDNGPFQSSGNLAPGATFSVTFNQTGTFDYHCSIHPSMLGKVIVQ